MTKSIHFREFFSTENLDHPELFDTENIFELFGNSLKARLVKFLETLDVKNNAKINGQVHPQAVIEGPVYIAEGAKIDPFTYIQGPCYIGPGAEIRQGAFIRGNVYVGRGAVVGHTTEVKGAIFLNEAKAGHFAYVGDSILGIDVNLGAGTKLANLKINHQSVSVRHPQSDAKLSTGLRKFGSILADGAQTGCNAVLSPGTILMPGTAVLPCVHYHGTLKKGFAR